MSIRDVSSIARRFVLASLVLVWVVSVANAYTIVMKGGRRVEIPSQFVMTQSTLTYEVQPGIQVTLQLAAIDVSATEKANNEKPGALVARAQTTSVQTALPSLTVASSRKTITNRDLEAAAQRRLTSEAAYDRKMKELGLPSAAEARRQLETTTAIAQAELGDRVAAERQTEESWRARASALRTEMAALDAEIRFVRTKLDEVPYSNWSGTYSSFSSFSPIVSFGIGGLRGAGRRHFPGFHSRGPGVYSARGTGSQVSGRIGFGGRRTRSQVFVNPVNRGHGTFGGGVRAGRWSGGHLSVGGIGSVGVLGAAPIFGSSAAYDYSYERSELITRFNELGAARAALNARWRELEDEARRAGAAPGWLRP